MTRIPPSTHRRRRSDGSARAVLLVAVAVATVLSLVPAPASAAPRDSEGVRAGRMFVMSVPGLTWTEIERYDLPNRSEEHTSELQSLMRISYAVFCLTKKNTKRI